MIAIYGVKSAGGGSGYSIDSLTSIPCASNLEVPQSLSPFPHAFPMKAITTLFIPRSEASLAIASVWNGSVATNLKMYFFSSGFVTPRRSGAAVEDGDMIIILFAVT